MKYYSKLLFFLSCCFFTQISFGQNKTIVSLIQSLKETKSDSARCTLLTSLTENIAGYNSDTALTLSIEIQHIAEKNLQIKNLDLASRKVFSKHLAYAINNLGYFKQEEGDGFGALSFYNKALKIQGGIGDKVGMANSLNGIAVAYDNLADIPKALDCHQRALKIREDIADKDGIAGSLNNIGFIYANQGENEKALECLNKALQIRMEQNDLHSAAISLTNIAGIYRSMGNFEKAMEGCAEAMKLREKIGDKWGIGNSLNNIGELLSKQGKKEEALTYFLKALKIQEEIGNPNAISYTINNIGWIYLSQKEYAKAHEVALRGATIAEKMRSPQNIASTAKLNYAIYKKTGKEKQALESYELFVMMKDSLGSLENKRATIKSQFKYEYEKRAAEDSLMNSVAQKITHAHMMEQSTQLKQEKFQRLVLIAGLLILIAGLGFVVNRSRLNQKQKRIIEVQKAMVDNAFERLAESNKQVMDSIYYAKKIQNSIMTTEVYIEKTLNRLKKDIDK